LPAALLVLSHPDTWHLKDRTYVSAQQIIDRLGSFAPAPDAPGSAPQALIEQSLTCVKWSDVAIG
jgi:hypothetical protein